MIGEDNSRLAIVGVVVLSFDGDSGFFLVGVEVNSNDGLRVLSFFTFSGVISCNTILRGEVFLLLVGLSSISSALVSAWETFFNGEQDKNAAAGVLIWVGDFPFGEYKLIGDEDKLLILFVGEWSLLLFFII